MPIVPANPLEKITFSEAHNAPFAANAVAIGTTAAKVTLLATQTAAARAAYLDQQVKQDAAKTATNAFKNAVATMSETLSEIIKEVKAKAASGGDAIFNLAQLPPPATPTPVGPPGMPFAFRATLNPDGSLELTWKCNNPVGSSGTIYQIARKVGASDFQPIGATGTKKFIDDTVPSVAAVTYRIQGIRSTSKGTPDQFTVSFGIGGAGEATASVLTGGAPKLAA